MTTMKMNGDILNYSMNRIFFISFIGVTADYFRITSIMRVAPWGGKS